MQNAKKKKKKKIGGGSVCKPRIQVILKIQKIVRVVRVRSGGEWGLGGLM